MFDAVVLTAALMGGPSWTDSGHAVWRTTPTWVRELGECVRHRESRGNYRAHSDKSSAAGAYQFIDATWKGNAAWAEWNGKRVAAKYDAANHAPAWVQDIVFVHAIEHGGIKAWKETACPGTR